MDANTKQLWLNRVKQGKVAVIESHYAPSNRNCLWLKDGVLMICGNSGWEVLSSGGDTPVDPKYIPIPLKFTSFEDKEPIPSPDPPQEDPGTVLNSMNPALNTLGIFGKKTENTEGGLTKGNTKSGETMCFSNFVNVKSETIKFQYTTTYGILGTEDEEHPEDHLTYGEYIDSNSGEAYDAVQSFIQSYFGDEYSVISATIFRGEYLLGGIPVFILENQSGERKAIAMIDTLADFVKSLEFDAPEPSGDDPRLVPPTSYPFEVPYKETADYTGYEDTEGLLEFTYIPEDLVYVIGKSGSYYTLIGMINTQERSMWGSLLDTDTERYDFFSGIIDSQSNNVGSCSKDNSSNFYVSIVNSLPQYDSVVFDTEYNTDKYPEDNGGGVA